MKAELVELLAQAGFRNLRTVRRIRRLLGQGRLDTSVVIIEAAASSGSHEPRALW